jgi:hypothetical protein
LGFGFWVLGFGFWVLGFGFWVELHSYWNAGAAVISTKVKSQVKIFDSAALRPK